MIKDHQNAKAFILRQPDPGQMEIREVVRRIVSLNRGLREFWSDMKGWGPDPAAELLSRSRLDWQVSLSECLDLWADPIDEDENGKLILAWTNLGSLVEGTLKLFVSAWHGFQVDLEEVRKANPRFKDPDIRSMEELRVHYRKEIWDKDWDVWLQRVQQRRNAVHAFKDRAIGTHDEFLNDVRQYLQLVRYINFRLPYPGREYEPTEGC